MPSDLLGFLLLKEPSGDWTAAVSAGCAVVAVLVTVILFVVSRRGQKQAQGKLDVLETAKTAAQEKLVELETAKTAAQEKLVELETAKTAAQEKLVELEGAKTETQSRLAEMARTNAVLQSERTKLAHANSEVQMQLAIDASWKSFDEIGLKWTDGDASEAKKKILGALMVASRERVLNVYDAYCQAYLDEKIDQPRFRKALERGVVRLFDSDQFPELEKRATDYRALVAVHDKWRGDP